MMNVERMHFLARFLDVMPAARFDMQSWIHLADGSETAFLTDEAVSDLQGHACGSSACVAGWAAYLFGTSRPAWMISYNAERIAAMAQTVLGLNGHQANWLFLGHWSKNMMSRERDPMKAARAIRHLIDHPDAYKCVGPWQI